MAEITKTISADDRLKYIALVTMAAEHARQASAYQEAILRLVGVDSCSYVSDIIWANDINPSIHQMDEALLKDGIGVED